jgi:hypothetical protein
LKDNAKNLSQAIMSKIPPGAESNQLTLIQLCNLYVSIKENEKAFMASGLDGILKALQHRLKDVATYLSKTELTENDLTQYFEALKRVLKCDKKNLSDTIPAIKALFVEQEITLSSNRIALLDRMFEKCANFPDALKIFKALHSALAKKGLEHATEFPFRRYFEHLSALAAKADIDYGFLLGQLKPYLQITEKDLAMSEATVPIFAPFMAAVLKTTLLNPKLEAKLVAAGSQPIEKYMQLTALVKKLLNYLPDGSNLVSILNDAQNPMALSGAAQLLKDKLDSYIESVKTLVQEESFKTSLKGNKKTKTELLNALKDKKEFLSMAKLDGSKVLIFASIVKLIN